MRTVKLDGAVMQSKQQMHAYLHAQLDLPDYYGWNLDALYDALTSYDKPLSIMFINKPELLDQLGKYGDALIKTLADAAVNNEFIEFKVV